MHSYWPSPAKSGLAATSSNSAQQLTAEQLHYQQQIMRHHFAASYQQQLAAANPLNYQMPSYGYLQALSHQALASMAANTLINGVNQQQSSGGSTTQATASTLLNSTSSTKNNSNNSNSTTSSSGTSSGGSTLPTTAESSSLANSLTSNLTNSLSSYAAVYNAQLNDMAATTAAFRTASAASGSVALSSAFQLSNSKKRALSSASPYFDSNEAQQMLNSIIRNSPSSLNSLLASSRSPSATGSMGHLSGTLSPSVNFFSNPLSHLVHSPSLFPPTTSPLGHLPSARAGSSLSQGSGANTPNSLAAFTSLSYNSLLGNNHNSAFTPAHQNNLQLAHYHNLLMQKMDNNGNGTGANGMLTKLVGSSPTSQHNLLYKNSTVELSPVSNPNSNSPKSTNSDVTSNGKKSAETQTSADEVVVSSTSLECKNKKPESESTATTGSSGSSPNHGLSSSRSSQHSDSSDIVITNSAKEEPIHQETCCYWEGCGPREFNDHLELVRHVSNEHINKDKKAPHVCRWPECSRKLKPFKANYMLDVHVRCHTGTIT